MKENKRRTEIEIVENLLNDEKNLINYYSEKEYIKEESSSKINNALKESIFKKILKLDLIIIFLF